MALENTKLSLEAQSLESISQSQQSQLAELFERAQAVARAHLEQGFQEFSHDFEEKYREKEIGFQLLLDSKSEEIKALDDRINVLNSLTQAKDESIAEMKLKFSALALSWRQRLEKRGTLSKVFHFWKSLAATTRASRETEALANRVSQNFVKSRVFSRFARNLLARNFAKEKRRYLESFNLQSSELFVRYERDVGELTRRTAAAEGAAERERALRLRLEEDVRRLLLKNMATMNLEALAALHQPLLHSAADEQLELAQMIAAASIEYNKYLHPSAAPSASSSAKGGLPAGRGDAQKENRDINTADPLGSPEDMAALRSRTLGAIEAELQNIDLSARAPQPSDPLALSGASTVELPRPAAPRPLLPTQIAEEGRHFWEAPSAASVPRVRREEKRSKSGARTRVQQ